LVIDSLPGGTSPLISEKGMLFVTLGEACDFLDESSPKSKPWTPSKLSPLVKNNRISIFRISRKEYWLFKNSSQARSEFLQSKMAEKQQLELFNAP